MFEPGWHSPSLASLRQDIRHYICSLSGSHTILPSSSYDANRFMKDEAATISEVEASNTTCEYGRERGTERAGKWASSCTSGIHSTKLGP